MSLLNNYLEILLKWRNCFVYSKTFKKAISHSFASLTEGQRKTITHNIRMLGQADKDCSCHYKLFQRNSWNEQNLFDPIIERIGSFSENDYIPMAGDFTTIRKTGKKIPFTAVCRDPLSPKYRANLILGTIFLQMSILVPLYKLRDTPARSLPVQWKVLPRIQKPRKNDSLETWENYKKFQKENNRSKFFIQNLKAIREQIDRNGFKHKRLLISLDGDFCNRIVLSAERDRIDLTLRARKNSKLSFRAQNEGRRFYSQKKFTPEDLRQNEEYKWESTTIFHGGKWRDVDYKEVKDVYWQSGGRKTPLRLIVIRPIPYRRTKTGKLLYRQPAYLLTTDLETSIEKLIQAYFDRWEIEVNHKEEKHILGVGHAQVWNENSIKKQSTMIVASYSALLLASILCSAGMQEKMKASSSWYRDVRRPSCNSLRQSLFKELKESQYDLENLFKQAIESKKVA